MPNRLLLIQAKHWSEDHDNPNRNLPSSRIFFVLAASIPLQDQLATRRRAILGMDLRMGSLVRMLALSLRNGCLVLVEGEEVSHRMAWLLSRFKIESKVIRYVCIKSGWHAMLDNGETVRLDDSHPLQLEFIESTK